MSIKTTRYYVQASLEHDTTSLLYGHTESEYMARQYCLSLQKNAYLNGSKNAKAVIDAVSFHGTIEEFHRFVMEDFDNGITGEDLIDIFETGLGNPRVPLWLPKQRIVSTSPDVIGGKFIEFAERFLLPEDIIGVQKALVFLQFVIGVTRDTFLHPWNIAEMVLLIQLVEEHPLFSENSPPFIQSMIFTEDATFDIVRYGIVKGWYHPI